LFPSYNPNDPLAGQDVIGGCAVCHNNPNIGNHSTSLSINIGVTEAQPTNNDGSVNSILDIANLPVYTLQDLAMDTTVQVTDPGKAMLSGKWTDIGKTKGPILRGLAARAPHFHNGSARDLTAVVDPSHGAGVGITRRLVLETRPRRRCPADAVSRA
jgi:cytochrome c peroxidase